MFNPKYLSELLTRSSHSGFKTLVLSNRSLLGCYTVDVDCDQGFHYALHIPDTEEYSDEFYDETLILDIAKINKAYKEGHKEADAERKDRKLKPKDLVEEGYYIKEKHSRYLKFVYTVAGELVNTVKVSLPWPFDPSAMDVEAIENAYSACLERVKVGGACLLFDLNRMGVVDYALSYPGSYPFTARVNGKKVVVPLTRTLFLGAKKFDDAFLSLQETTIDGIYLFALSLTNKGLNENLWGYLIRY